MTELPKYSTDIRDAFLVVRKINDEGYYFRFDQFLGGWRVEIKSRTGSGDPIALAVQKTLPAAICIAALELREIQKNEQSNIN